jgi:hypothetical protein
MMTRSYFFPKENLCLSNSENYIVGGDLNPVRAARHNAATRECVLVHPRGERFFRTAMIDNSAIVGARQRGRCVVSPTLVQVNGAEEKLCERGIATASRCATIGTVQEISNEISGTLHQGILLKAPPAHSSGAHQQQTGI